jgi:hypothetical protein
MDMSVTPSLTVQMLDFAKTIQMVLPTIPEADVNTESSQKEKVESTADVTPQKPKKQRRKKVENAQQ